MAYSINITEVTPVVTVTNTQSPISVTTENKFFTITESTFVITATSVVNTVTVYTDAVELLVDDFANYFRGDWISGTTYHRGELVNDRYSLFVCSTGTLTTVTSTINPSDYTDTLSWTRVVWNEAPRDHLTITNYLEVGTDLEVGGTTHLVGELTMDTALDHLTVTNHLSAGSLSVGTAEGDGLTINAQATFNGRSTFNNDVIITAGTTTVTNLVVLGSEIVQGALTVNNSGTFYSVYADEINIAGTGTFQELFTDRLTVADVLYPTVSGLYGQVIANMGDGTAEWRNLGDLNFWSLNDDLRTNGFDIVTNSLTEDLLVGIGLGATKKSNSYLELKYNAPSTLKGIDGITVDGNTSSLELDNSQAILRAGSGSTLTLNQNGGSGNSLVVASSDNTAALVLSGDAGHNLISSNQDLWVRSGGDIQIGQTSVAGQNAVLQATDSIQIRTNGAVGTGKIIVGPVTSGSVPNVARVEVSTTGTFIYGIDRLVFEDGSVQLTANTATVSTATSTTVGGIKVGSYLDITSDGTLSVNTASLASITLNTATSTLLGGVKIGSSFTAQGDGTLGMSTATAARLGGVRIGDYLQSSSDGILTVNTATLFSDYGSANTATTARAGIVRIGDNVRIDGDARISVPTAAEDTWGVSRIKVNGGIKTESLAGSPGFISLYPATTTRIGGVIAGNNINIDSDGVISVAGGGIAGVINLTDVMNTNGYHIQHNYLNTASFIDVNTDNVELSATEQVLLSKPTSDRNYSRVTLDRVGLSEQVILKSNSEQYIGGQWLYTSTSELIVGSGGITATSVNYDFIARAPINHGFVGSRSINLLADNDVNISAFDTVNVRATGTVAISANTTTITGSNLDLDVANLSITSANTLTLAAPVVVIGEDEYHSELHVQKIYNHAGTYAPFFPAGIQLADNTVQVTAYHPDGGPLPAV